jgi:uncharacterized integral membrane protein
MLSYWKALSPWRKFKLVFSILIFIFVVVFAILNWQIVEIRFIFFKLNISVTLLIILCLVLGFIISSIFDHRKFRKKDKEILELKDQLLLSQMKRINQDEIKTNPEN